MKKSLLALAVIFAASTSQAATVYDKDGTTLSVGGRIQSVFYHGNTSYAAGHKDSTLSNSSRLNVRGATKINDYITAFAFTEWNMADGNKKGAGDGINTREQYVGADFGRFGKLTIGKTYDAAHYGQMATTFQWFDDWGGRGVANTAPNRRTGQFNYTYNDNNIFFTAAYQAAEDSVDVGTFVKTFKTKTDVEGGFSVAAGYTFDDVLFGPLSLKAYYSYLDGQDDKSTASYVNAARFDSYKYGGVSAAWGNVNEGLYLGALYQRSIEKLNSTEFDTVSVNGYELVVSYNFESGIKAQVGYNAALGKRSSDGKSFNYRRVPVYVSYKPVPNVLIWSEAEFDASTSEDAKKVYGYNDDIFWSVGARYTF